MKTELKDHFLFKNRYRVLAVSAPPTAPATSNGRLVLLNVTVGLLIVAFFMVGFWAGHPTQTEAVTALPGQWWDRWLEGRFGADLGSGLAEKSPWMAARAGGILIYLLAFFSVILGLVSKLKWLRAVLHPARLMYLHRLVALLMLVFTVVHVGGLLLDAYLKMNLFEVLVPFTAGYRPLWTGLGTVAIYAAIIIVVTAYLAGRLGYRVWHSLHYLSYGLFAIGFLHGLMAGTDSAASWMQFVYMITGFVVVTLGGVRFFGGSIWVKS
jgi:sulfoxide reductase heme-binding subunit YedZ